MPQLSRKTTFYAVLSAGAAFIAIGIASVIYNNTPVDVSLDATSNFAYNLIAKKEGVHRIEIKNVGSSELAIGGHAKTKGSEIAFGGQMMLIITGIIVTGFSLRLRH